jgi:hypothetical protein
VNPFLADESPLLKTLRRRARRRIHPAVVPAAVSLGIVVVGSLFIWDRTFNHSPRPKPVSSAASASHIPVKDAHHEVVSLATPARRPIALLLAPAGASVVVHLRPADLWSPGGRGAELWRCLPEWKAWMERMLRERCLFPPEEIAEVVFSFVLRTPGEPPDAAATVQLVRPSTAEEIATRFGGEADKQRKLKAFVKSGRVLIIRDAQTFAIGPLSAAEEMIDAAQNSSPTDETIENLLKQTDRSRDLSVICRPDELDRFREVLVAPSAAPLVHFVSQWLDPDAVEGVAISLCLKDPFRMQMVVRNRPATPVHREQIVLRQRLDQLPKDVLRLVEHERPPTSGHRKLIGRLPAMCQALAMATKSSLGKQTLFFEAILPDRAAPNLALATFLAWTDAGQSTAELPNRGPRSIERAGERATTSVIQRLQKKVDVEFRRTPLSDAFASIGEDIGVTFEIDGAALKGAGYTKNMPQNLRLSAVPATEALRAILKPYPQMALVVVEARQAITVTTKTEAKAKGWTPLTLEN